MYKNNGDEESYTNHFMSFVCQESKSLQELQYLNLVKRILEKGSYETTRNGFTKTVFGECMRFSLENGTIPLLTSKRVAWKTCFEELMWFIRGDTNNKNLQKKGVHIWDGNATKEFLDKQGLDSYPEGILGPIYGWQWRRWNAPYTINDPMGSSEGDVKGIDQLAELIKNLKDPEKRSSRRHVISAWNVAQLDEMALPPCHVLMQFHVRDGLYLSCALYQRSGDVGLGVPFNIASYSFLTHILAKHCDLIPEEFVYFLGNAHIYEQHIEPLTQQLKTTENLYEFPKLRFRQKHESIEDYSVSDIEWIEQYRYHDAVKMEFVP